MKTIKNKATQEIVIDNNSYNINSTIWEHYLLMHTVRPIDALKSSLKLVFPDGSYDVNDIEETIEDEYKMRSQLDDIVVKAEEIYEKNRNN